MTQAAQSIVFVDGNNGMASRPDGWWRDRAGPPRKLVAEIIPLALGHGGAWTIVFDGQEPPALPPPPECLTVIHTRHRRRAGADDRTVVHEHPDRTASLVYTSDAKLRTRVKSLATQVMGSGTFLSQIATPRATTKPTGNGQTPDSTDGSANDNHATEELPTICSAEARNREHSRLTGQRKSVRVQQVTLHRRCMTGRTERPKQHIQYESPLQAQPYTTKRSL